jgi:hypothetical protein
MHYLVYIGYLWGRCCELGIAEPKEDCPRKLPRQIDDNPQTAVHMSAKDKLRVSFYYNVSYLVLSVCIPLLSPSVQQIASLI